MKIGIVTPANLPVPAVYGGAIETLIEDFIKENEKVLFHDIVIFSEYNKKAKEMSLQYVKTKFIWFHDGIIYYLFEFIFRVLKKFKIIKIQFIVFFVSHFIKKHNLDLIIVEGNPVYVKYLKKRHGENCKIVFHIHARLIEARDGHLVNALEYSDKVIVVSEFIKSDFLKRFKIDPNKIEVVHNCASQAFFNNVNLEQDKLTLKKHLGVDSTDFVLIFAGRLVPDKGLLELVRSCKKLNDRIKFKLLIIGSFGSDFGKINNKKNAFQVVVQNEIYGVEQNFIFCGYIPNDVITKYYAIADLAVIPSLFNDPAPLVAIEAMSAALPLIYSNKGGIKEYVSPKCGIMIDMDADDCVEKIAWSIIKLHDDLELRKSMSSASFKNAKRFTPKSYYENLGMHLNDLKVKRVAE